MAAGRLRATITGTGTGTGTMMDTARIINASLATREGIAMSPESSAHSALSAARAFLGERVAPQVGPLRAALPTDGSMRTAAATPRLESTGSCLQAVLYPAWLRASAHAQLTVVMRLVMNVNLRTPSEGIAQ